MLPTCHLFSFLIIFLILIFKAFAQNVANTNNFIEYCITNKGKLKCNATNIEPIIVCSFSNGSNTSNSCPEGQVCTEPIVGIIDCEAAF